MMKTKSFVFFFVLFLIGTVSSISSGFAGDDLLKEYILEEDVAIEVDSVLFEDKNTMSVHATVRPATQTQAPELIPATPVDQVMMNNPVYRAVEAADAEEEALRQEERKLAAEEAAAKRENSPEFIGMIKTCRQLGFEIEAAYLNALSESAENSVERRMQIYKPLIAAFTQMASATAEFSNREMLENDAIGAKNGAPRAFYRTNAADMKASASEMRKTVPVLKDVEAYVIGAEERQAEIAAMLAANKQGLAGNGITNPFLTLPKTMKSLPVKYRKEYCSQLANKKIPY